MPGRIVGATVDTNGKKGYVLTLQAREQHIPKEEKANLEYLHKRVTLCACSNCVYGADG